MGAARKPSPPLPRILDRRARQDGLHTQGPPLGRLRWPALAPVRSDRYGMSRHPTVLLALAALSALALAACVRVNVHGAPPQSGSPMPDPAPLRVASYNVSLFDEDTGGLVQRLELGNAQARRIAAVLQKVRPDIVLLNEFDHDPAGRAADLFQRRYLEQPQPGGGEPLHCPCPSPAPVNTGVPSGLDLAGSGSVGGAGRERGNDAWGYGLHPGQYGMLLLSKHPID